MSTEKEEIEAVGLFKADMLRKLRLNGHKKHWNESSYTFLHECLEDEFEELMAELRTLRNGGMQGYDNIIDECADVANFAMMIADNARRDKEPDTIRTSRSIGVYSFEDELIDSFEVEKDGMNRAIKLATELQAKGEGTHIRIYFPLSAEQVTGNR